MDANGAMLPFGAAGVHKRKTYADSTMCIFVFDILHMNGKTDPPASFSSTSGASFPACVFPTDAHHNSAWFIPAVHWPGLRCSTFLTAPFGAGEDLLDKSIQERRKLLEAHVKPVKGKVRCFATNCLRPLDLLPSFECQLAFAVRRMLDCNSS